MFLNVAPSSELAIYDQIVRQVRLAVTAGSVEPCRGERVHSELVRLSYGLIFPVFSE